jgi:hypothetical protein
VMIGQRLADCLRAHASERVRCAALRRYRQHGRMSGSKAFGVTWTRGCASSTRGSTTRLSLRQRG